MTLRVIQLVAIAFVVVAVGCSDETEPIYDGYRLVGTARDSTSGAPIESLQIFTPYAQGDTIYYDPTYVFTNADGNYTLDVFPATGPSNEKLRFAKLGYRPKDFVVAAAAVQEERFRYRLDVELTPQPAIR